MYNLNKNIDKDNMGKKIIIFKPRAIIHSTISHRLSQSEIKFYNLALKKAKEKINFLSSIEKYKPIVEDWQNGVFEVVPSISISISELKKLFPGIGSKTKKQIYDLFLRMSKVQIEKINIFKKDEDKNNIIKIEETTPDKVTIAEEDFEQVERVDLYNLISNVSIRFADDVVTFYLPPVVIAYLANPKMYASFNLLTLNYLHKTYSMILYEILIDIFENQKRKGKKDLYESGVFSLDKLKELLNISKDKYKRYADFKKKVLIPSIKELNETDVVPFYVDFQEIKKGKKVVGINFLMEAKPEFLISDVILTKSGPKKVTYQDKQIKIIKQYPVKKELLKLKEKVKGKALPYLIFKRELMKIQDSYICNRIDGYLPHLLLRTNSIGHLEFYNPQDDKIRELDKIKDTKELESIRRWLYENPDRIGDIKEINEDEIFINDLLNKMRNKYYFFMQNGFYYGLKIENVDVKENVIFIKGEEVIEGIEKIIKYSRHEIDNILQKLMENVDDDKIAYYRELNKARKKELLIEEFKKVINEKTAKKLIEKLEKESLELTNEWIKAEKEEKSELMDKISQKISSIDEIIVALSEYLTEKTIPNTYLIKKILKMIKE